MNKEQFEEWKSHPVTVEVLKEVDNLRDDLKEALASGTTLGDEVLTARMVGNIEGLNQILNIEYEEAGDEE